VDAALIADVESAFEAVPEPEIEPEIVERNDELERIEGIGPKIAAALRAAGITTYARLADAERSTVETALENANLRFAPSLATWSRQARLLADGDEDGFKELTGRLIAGREVAPKPVEPEPVAVEPEPVAVESEPVAVEPEPVAVEPEPEPVAVEPEPEPVAVSRNPSRSRLSRNPSRSRSRSRRSRMTSGASRVSGRRCPPRWWPRASARTRSWPRPTSTPCGPRSTPPACGSRRAWSRGRGRRGTWRTGTRRASPI
jgi:predicted flap endonuclease-1-like 5' DNA nuclease